MEFEFAEKNGYRVVRIKKDIPRESDLNELKSVVKSHLEDGTVTHLAVSFTKETSLYSPLIAVLVQFLGLVKERDGNLAVVHPNEGMLDVLRLVGLGKLMQLYASEEEIGS